MRLTIDSHYRLYVHSPSWEFVQTATRSALITLHSTFTPRGDPFVGKPRRQTQPSITMTFVGQSGNTTDALTRAYVANNIFRTITTKYKRSRTRRLDASFEKTDRGLNLRRFT